MNQFLLLLVLVAVASVACGNVKVTTTTTTNAKSSESLGKRIIDSFKSLLDEQVTLLYIYYVYSYCIPFD